MVLGSGKTMSAYNIDVAIRRAIALGLLRVDNDLPEVLDLQYMKSLKAIGELIERLRHGMTIRRMMYDHAELCTVPLEQQVKEGLSRDEPSDFSLAQQWGLEVLSTSNKSLPENKQSGSINNPNIIVNCDSGTDGELGCAPKYVKVYQAVYSASYGANNYKDVFLSNETGAYKFKIQPAPGGKCNVGIGNPYRAVGWFMNYRSQGSKAPLIRMWEIPAEYFVFQLLLHCGTEKQIKDKNDKRNYFVEMCDHKAVNQFGIWTHQEEVVVTGTGPTTRRTKELRLTKYGREFVDVSCNLITYYDPKGTHAPDARDGTCRDIRVLLNHLGIPTLLDDRFEDFGMSLADAEGNLTMNADAAQRDQELLEVIDLIQSPATNSSSKINKLDKEKLRHFSNVLIYNNLSPQKFNKSAEYTKRGLDIRNLRAETSFMVRVYRGTHWHDATRFVIGEMLKTIEQTTVLPQDIKTALPKFCFTCTTYADVLRKVLQAIGPERNNVVVIDSLNVILRPLCSGGTTLKIDRVTTRGQMFHVDILSDLQFEIGKSHRAELKGHEGIPDALDGHQGGGFVHRSGFGKKLDSSIKVSNANIQLNLHDPVVSRLWDLGIPMLGGISGTTRDIFATLRGSLYNQFKYWSFFNVVAAFMIKYHYHSLIECFIAAHQLAPTFGNALSCKTADEFYAAVMKYSKTTFHR